MTIGGGNHRTSEHTKGQQVAISWRIIVGGFASAMLYGLFAFGVRASQFTGPLPGDPTLAAFATGFGWLLASIALLDVTGGFVFPSHMLSFLITGAFFGKFTNFQRDNDNSDIYYHHIDWKIALEFLFGAALGFYVSGLLAWAIYGSLFVQFIAYSPGPYPGFNADFIGNAVWGEIISAFALAFVVEIAYLRNNARWVPFIGAIAIGVSAFLLFNISGPAIDLVAYSMAGLAAGTASGIWFPGAVSAGWLWLYLFAGLGGALVGSILAHVVNRFMPDVKNKHTHDGYMEETALPSSDEESSDEGEDESTDDDTLKRRYKSGRKAHQSDATVGVLDLESKLSSLPGVAGAFGAKTMDG